ncbi:unknown [Clostridium sp. CAG:813]|nr:unknown [Clostridium sp. CAG:813]
MVAVSGVSNYSPVNYVNFRGKAEKAEALADNQEILATKAEMPEDSFEVQHKEGKRELTKADKQEIIQKARTKAVGWSIFGEGFSTLYYALRSDKTIAKKFDLDLKEDKKLIKQIKRDQTLATLPAVVPGLGSAGALVAYIYCKNQDPEDIKVH